MRPHPEDQPSVFAVPATALMMAEETPGKPVVLIHHEDANPASSYAIADIGAGRHVLFPDDGEEERTGTVHDGDVWQVPVLVVGS